MLVVRAPLRITLGGGGSDLGDGGICIAAAISLSVYVAVHHNLTDEYVLRYSEIERVHSADEVKHPLLRQALKITETEPGIEIASFADVPARSGLGSSGAFSVATLHALGCTPTQAARYACDIDFGWQDQWISALGGVQMLTQTGNFQVRLTDKTIQYLNDGLHLYDTGLQRDAHEVLASTRRPDKALLTKQASTSLRALELGNMEAFAHCLSHQWRAKLHAAPTPEHLMVDQMIQELPVEGAKLVGAGNGGYILAYHEDPITTPLREVPFTLDFLGTRCL